MSYTEAARNAALDEANSGITHLQLHTGEPGAAGTANVAAGVSRAAVTGVGGASGGADSFTAEFTIPGAGGPFTHFSAWTASTGGTFVTEGPLDPEETFGGAGTLAVTINTTAANAA